MHKRKKTFSKYSLFLPPVEVECTSQLRSWMFWYHRETLPYTLLYVNGLDGLYWLQCPRFKIGRMLKQLGQPAAVHKVMQNDTLSNVLSECKVQYNQTA